MSRATREITMNFLVNEVEKEAIEANAAFFAMPVAAFVRHVALGGTIDWKDRTMRKRAAQRREAAA